MTEGITYNDLGTVDVTFDDKTYHLGRPKFRQFRYFSEQLEKHTTALADEVRRLGKELAAARNADVEDEAEVERLSAEVKALVDIKLYDKTIPILAEMFAQVGDPLPEDVDEWPAWLAADAAIPGEILKHWRNSPKASGEPPQS